MERQTQLDIIKMIHREVLPATGCTEPVAVALTTAYAAQILTGSPTHIRLDLSANVLKNAMGVGIPGTGMIGLPIAVALGAVIAQPEKELKVLDNFSEEQFAEAKRLVEEHRIDIALKEGDVDKLYIEVAMDDDQGNHALAIIQRTHTELHTLTLNGKPLKVATAQGEKNEGNNAFDGEEVPLTFDMVYRFATEMPLEEISFILEAAQLNRNAAEYSLRGDYGHGVGKMIRGDRAKKYLGDNTYTHLLTYTSAACDARMDGAPVTVMSNSGSGNQGITATLPVLSFAEDEGATEEQKIRALMLSNLMVIYIKQKLGRLSALCGCVVASTGSASGITYLMGGTREQIGFAIKNMVGNLTGMICDGAKPSCSLKVTSGVSSAMLSALLAMEERVVTSNEGVVDDDIDRSIDNLTSIGRDAMTETDRHVLHIMTHKH
ncbi:MAG: L-serine ammonia-lyase, iron-sulfur-dependent, subunit alpha [Bacteroidales bacterium]|uniref:L-cysteine desulfidase family protein n=1 Tax=Porphyromonas sp. TaxID=1924944 RepID=UPI002979E653|nr:L-serine ammonia-lyase, iron-sulfur-dependent, subunit alpha [Porphyromonas sp.]MDD7438693.1 L-serine ammonia-lyase, iron-sulfur-dependent, subunit alpha [Bacteroidales bacterium]MDY3066951.1 L-serine ammonia-lyase, iron-sulfur-dependent, subunit alpha [Porphyromonas sp.]